MGTAAESVPAVSPARNIEKVSGFDPVAMRAPFFLRCGAIAFDYMLIVVWPVLGLLLGRYFGIDGTRLITGDANNIAWLVGILVGFCNQIVLPIFTGQSLGKMIAGLRIVTLTGTHPSPLALALRQSVGYVITLASLGIGFLVSAFSSKGRALHDYLTATTVVYGRSRVRSEK